jgi:Arc/MetJ family transcription regulator
MTRVRWNPAVTENRRETVEGLNRRISCIAAVGGHRVDPVAQLGGLPPYIRCPPSEIYCRWKGTAMAKTLIDVDEEQLAAAQKVLKTGTKKDTVNAALRQVTALAARRRDLQRLVAGGLPDLADEEVMRAAWQQ